MSAQMGDEEDKEERERDRGVLKPSPQSSYTVPSVARFRAICAKQATLAACSDAKLPSRPAFDIEKQSGRAYQLRPWYEEA